MFVARILRITILIMLALAASPAFAREVLVSNIAALDAALREPSPGDVIILRPGQYKLNGGDYKYLFGDHLENVTIRSQDPANPAIIDGEDIGRVVLFRSPQNLVLEDLIIQNMTEAGINIDDNDDSGEISNPWRPASNIVLRKLIVRNIGQPGGNIDGIKLSGLSDFHIDGVQVIDWGNGGSAIDMVGCHNGIIENSLFRSKHENIRTTGLVTKGGSRNITIRKNRIQLPKGFGRAIKLGGSTSDGLFRFTDSDSGYEAREITVEDNTIVGGRSAFSYVNIDGGLVQRNTVYTPGEWVIRILNEAEVDGLVKTRNGQFIENTVTYDGTLKTAINIGENTLPKTFVFRKNHWYNRDKPANSKPELPSPEIGGRYGKDPGIDLVDPGTSSR